MYKERLIKISEDIKEDLPLLCFDNGARYPWMHHSWSQGTFCYKFYFNKLYLSVEWDNQERMLFGFFDVIM